MKEGWQKKPLAELIDIQSGFAFKSQDYTSKGHFLVRIGNVQDGCLSLDNPKYVVLDKNTSRFALREGDLLTSLTGNIGRVAIVEAHHLPAALNQRVARMTPKNSEIPDKGYLRHFLSSSYFRQSLSSVGHGAAQQNVSPAEIGNIKVPFPSLAEQRRIAAILDGVFEGIDTAVANAAKNLANARELFENYLNSVFNEKVGAWPEKNLNEVGQLQTGTTPKTSEQNNLGAYIPFIKPGDFREDGSLDYENEGLSEVGLTQSRLIRSGSAVMVCIGATIGKAGFAERDISANQQINAVTPREGTAGKFLYYQMISDRFQKQVMANSAQATLPIINKTKWGGLVMLLPPTHREQEQFVRKTDKLSSEIRRLEETYRQKLASLAELKQAILQKAFGGELTARSTEAVPEAAE